MPQLIELTLIGKPDCHLCENANAAVERVLFGFRSGNPALTVSLEQKNILDDVELDTRYREEIPVLLINGKVHNYWRIDEAKLRAALDELARIAE
jgi:hypothetical protein